MTATIFEIQRSSLVDGPGLRTTVFFKGCNLKCKWCHNPESQSPKPQLMHFKSKCDSCGLCEKVCPRPHACNACGLCAKACPKSARSISGKEYTIAELFQEIVRDKLFYELSGGGVTFSGGECMLQIEFLTEILKKCKHEGINTAVDTAGNVPFEYFSRILPYTDIFLYDVKAVDDSLHILGTGVSNKIVLENLTLLSRETGARLIVRTPVIPSFNDSESELYGISAFLQRLHLTAHELLPYNPMSKHKYDALSMSYFDFNKSNLQ